MLVVADHDSKHLAPGTLNTITAASQLGDVEVLVAGEQIGDIASVVSKVKGVKKVITVDSADLKHPRAERLTEVSLLFSCSPYICQVVLAEQAKGQYTHVLAPASAHGKNFIPRVGAYLDVQPLSEVQQIISEDTFVRPIYAGNALLTLKSKDAVKVMTIRYPASRICSHFLELLAFLPLKLRATPLQSPPLRSLLLPPAQRPNSLALSFRPLIDPN